MYISNPNSKIAEALKKLQDSSRELEQFARKAPFVFAKYHKAFALGFLNAKTGKDSEGNQLSKIPSDEVAKQMALAQIPDEVLQEYYEVKYGSELETEVSRNNRKVLDALLRGQSEIDANDNKGSNFD